MLSTDLSLGCPLNRDVTNVTHFQGHYRNDPLVVLGGASSVRLPFARNQIEIQLLCVFLKKIPVIQFAKFSGFSPIITTASLKHSVSWCHARSQYKLSSWWYQNSNRRDHRWGTYHIRLSPCPAHKLPPSKWWTLRDRRYSCCLRRSSRSMRLGSLNTNRNIEINVYEIHWMSRDWDHQGELLACFSGWRLPLSLIEYIFCAEDYRRMEYNRVSGVKLVVHP